MISSAILFLLAWSSTVRAVPDCSSGLCPNVLSNVNRLLQQTACPQGTININGICQPLQNSNQISTFVPAASPDILAPCGTECQTQTVQQPILVQNCQPNCQNPPPPVVPQPPLIYVQPPQINIPPPNIVVQAPPTPLREPSPPITIIVPPTPIRSDSKSSKIVEAPKNQNTTIEILNVINNTNIHNVITNINASNINNIKLNLGSLSSNKNSQSNYVGFMSGSYKSGECCVILAPRSCVPYEGKVKCYHRRYHKCGDECLARQGDPENVVLYQDISEVPAYSNEDIYVGGPHSYPEPEPYPEPSSHFSGFDSSQMNPLTSPYPTSGTYPHFTDNSFTFSEHQPDHYQSINPYNPGNSYPQTDITEHMYPHMQNQNHMTYPYLSQPEMQPYPSQIPQINNIAQSSPGSFHHDSQNRLPTSLESNPNTKLPPTSHPTPEPNIKTKPHLPPSHQGISYTTPKPNLNTKLPPTPKTTPKYHVNINPFTLPAVYSSPATFQNTKLPPTQYPYPASYMNTKLPPTTYPSPEPYVPATQQLSSPYSTKMYPEAQPYLSQSSFSGMMYPYYQMPDYSSQVYPSMQPYAYQNSYPGGYLQSSNNYYTDQAYSFSGHY